MGTADNSKGIKTKSCQGSDLQIENADVLLRKKGGREVIYKMFGFRLRGGDVQ
jgi:hypothetical protein